MRKFIFGMIIAIPLLVQAQTNLTPDHTWHDNSGTGWYTSGYGTCFYNYNGLLYCFNYHDNGIYNGAYPYIYTINANHDYASMAAYPIGSDHKNRIDNFGYQGENYAYYRPPMRGRNMAFQYEGRLWFFQQVGASYTDDNQWKHKDESYQCFGQMPVNPSNTDAFSYYYKDVYDPAILKYGAFQFDSNLYFVSQYTGGNKQFCLQEYLFNTSSNKFYYNREIDLSAIPGCNMFGGVVKRLDSLGNEYVVLCTYYEGNGIAKVGKLTPGLTTDKKRTFAWTLLADNTTIFPGSKVTNVSTIGEGTIKGCRTSDPTPTSPDRMLVFGLNHDKSSDGYYHISYREIRWEKDKPVLGTYGELVLPTSTAPSKAGDHYEIMASVELKPMDYSTRMSGIDGYQSYLWLFYPDGSHHFNGAQFTSDIWKFDPNHVITSLDIGDDSDSSGYGKDIRKLWSLVGIIEGPPPVSVNWPGWDETFPSPTAPSTLSIGESTTKTVEFSNSTEDEWSIGESVEVGANITKKLSGSFSEEFKYSNTYKNTVQHKFDTTIKYEYPFELFEDGQPYGYYLYTVPQFKRYTYNLYPWWDVSTQQYPIPYLMQYLFRVTGIGTSKVPIPLTGSPYYVADPNGSSMNGWKYVNRTALKNCIELYDLKPCIVLDWDDLSNGNIGEISAKTDSSSTYENTTKYEIGGSLGVQYKSPDVFKISVKVTGNWSQTFSNETTVESSFENSISASLENLYSKNDGLNISHLHMNLYMLRPETAPTYWLYDSLDGAKPWYIVYMVNTASTKLNLVAPTNASVLKSSELLFNWEPENGELGDYKIFISKSPNFDKGNILYQETIGSNLQLSVSAFKPEKGVTYYWTVRGKATNGEPVWSPVWTFTLKQDGIGEQSQGLKALVSPNPAKSADIHISVDSKTLGNIVITLRNVDGLALATKEIPNTAALPVNITFPDLHLQPGIYFAEIRAGNEQIVRKVIVQ